MRFALMVSLSFLTTFLMGWSNAQAVDLAAELAAAQKLIKENVPVDTELKAANVLSGYSRLMGVLADQLAGFTGSTRNLFPQMRSTLQEVNDPAYAYMVAELKSQMVVLVESLNKNNSILQKMAQDIEGKEGWREKYPQAGFLPMLSQVVKLTKEMAVNFQNYTIHMNDSLQQIEGLLSLIEQQSPDLAERVKQLSETTQSAERYTLEGIGERFRSLSSVIQQIYHE